MREGAPSVRFHLTAAETQSLFQLEVASPEPGNGIQDRRFTIEHELFRARSRVISLEGLAVILGTNHARADLELSSEQEPPPIVLSLTFQGSFSGSRDGSYVAPHAAPHAHGISYFPEPLYRFRLDRDHRQTVFEVNLTKDYAESLFGRFPGLLRSELHAIDHEKAFSEQSRPGALTSGMVNVAFQIIHSEHHGPARAMFIEAKVLELLALQLRDLLHVSGLDAPRRPLRSAEVERMHEAHAVLLSRMQNPPTLAELSHLVGTNEFALKNGFKSVFGSTVYGVLFDRRMDLARALLLETDSTLERIAEEVGYSSAAHLSAAFRRKFGYRPSQLRKDRS